MSRYFVSKTDRAEILFGTSKTVRQFQDKGMVECTELEFNLIHLIDQYGKNRVKQAMMRIENGDVYKPKPKHSRRKPATAPVSPEYAQRNEEII